METAHTGPPSRMIDVTSLNAFLHQMHHAETSLGLAAVVQIANAQKIYLL